MPDWHKYLTADELAGLAALDSRIWENQARRRKLMNRAKQRKHRDANRAKQND
jgi:hypothetical protein